VYNSEFLYPVITVISWNTPSTWIICVYLLFVFLFLTIGGNDNWKYTVPPGVSLFTLIHLLLLLDRTELHARILKISGKFCVAQCTYHMYYYLRLSKLAQVVTLLTSLQRCLILILPGTQDYLVWRFSWVFSAPSDKGWLHTQQHQSYDVRMIHVASSSRIKCSLSFHM
jgi:hypothetical protein